MNKEMLDVLKQNIRNSFSEEGKAASDAINAALEALAADDKNEYGAEAVKEAAVKAVEDLFKDENDVPEEVVEMLRKITSNAIEARIDVLKTVANEKTIPNEVKSQIASVIVNANSKDDCKNKIDAILAKNGISGLEFAHNISYSIVENWGDTNELVSALNWTPLDEWFYTTQDLTDSDITAKRWGDNSTGTKAIQDITTTPVKIEVDYVYKIAKVANKILARIRKNGKETEFIDFLTRELVKQLNNGIAQAILVGDLSNTGTSKISQFATITRSTTDAFVGVVTAAESGTSYATLEEARAARDTIADHGEAVWAVMNRAQFTKLATFIYGSGGSTSYKSREEVAGMLDVERIYIVDWVKGANGAHIVFITPKEYWCTEDESLQFVYPTPQDNSVNYQVERLCGGKIHGLASCAVVLPKPDEDEE